jgi:ABC-type branched-subunit amino acid transport system substrate-binding protein
MRRWYLALASALVLGLTLAACGGGGEAEVVTVEKEVVVEKEVLQVVEVEKEILVEKEVVREVEVEKEIEVVKEVEVVREVEKVLPVKSLGIGTMTIRTGSGASFGVPFDTGQSIAANRVNDAGGIVIGDVRYLVKHEKLDSKWEVPIMLSISEQFINRRKYKFVITGGSPMIEVMDPVSTPAQAIHMSTTWHLEPCASAWTFCTMATHFDTAPYFFETIKEMEPQVKTVFYAGVNFTYDIGAAGLTGYIAEQMGFEYDKIFIEWPTTDLLGIVTGIVAKNPDMILLGGLTGDGPGFIRLARDLGYEGVLGSVYAFPTMPQLLDAFKGGEEHLMENYYAIEEHSYDSFGGYADPDLVQLVADYDLLEPGTPQAGIITAFYTMDLLLKGIQEAQTVDDTDKIAAALETLEVPNIFLPGDPIMSFGGAGKSDVELIKRQEHLLWNAMAMNIYKDGKSQTLKIISTIPTGPIPVEHERGN